MEHVLLEQIWQHWTFTPALYKPSNVLWLSYRTFSTLYTPYSGKTTGSVKGVMRTQECGKDPGGRRGKQQAMLTTCPFIPENHLSSFL